MLIQGLKYPESFFDTRNKTKEITPDEAMSEVEKAILDAKIRQYIEREARTASNKNRIYNIIWGNLTLLLQSVLKGNKY